jgi:hypothetical protein
MISLLREPAHRRRLGLLAVSGGSAGLLGFLAFKPATLESLVRFGGYYYIATVLVLFVGYFWRVVSARRAVWTEWLTRSRGVGFALLVATAFVLWSDSFKHKILFDEYVLQSTAYQMHVTKEFGTLYRAYHIAGSWLPLDSFVDKRPYFFTFLVSLAHDFTGYRIANIFLVNAALTPVFLGLVYWIARTLTSRGPALLAVGMLATLPLLGQNATGAGMELHNLTMVVLVAALAVLYLRAPDDDRLVTLVLGAVLLSQSRYESVIFVVPVGLIVVLGWIRAGRVMLPWPVIVGPLLLVPYVWHNRLLAATPQHWQLLPGQTSRFSVDYLANNLDGAWSFFFSFSGRLANSWYLSILGAAAVVWLLARAWRWARVDPRRPLAPGTIALLGIAAGIVANLTILMFYYWSRLDDVIASRFALPTCLLLAVLAAVMIERMGARLRFVGRAALVGLIGWLVVGASPAIARRIYTDENVVMQEVEWERSVLDSRRGPLLFIANKSNLPLLLRRIASLNNTTARQRGLQIAYHLREGTFREVIVAQGLRPTSERGELGIDPQDLMPPEFQLETIAEKRFGTRWTRLSRVVAINPAPVSPLSVP